MPRAPRIDGAGTIHHVAARGVARAAIFLDDADREDLLRRLDRILTEGAAQCLAWALIPNHFHLVIRTGPTRLSRLMSRIETGYARRFNERYTRVGHVFQNRYLSRPVIEDGDLMGVIRYVHANPLRHGILASPAALPSFPWCGHGALLGTMPARRFHAVGAALQIFGASRREARRRLCLWMAASDAVGSERAGDGERQPDEGERLEDACRARADDRDPFALRVGLDRLVQLVAAATDVAPCDLRSPSKSPAAVRARALMAYLATTSLGASYRSISTTLRVSERSAARAAARGAALAGERADLAASILQALGESPGRRERPRQ